MKMEDAVTISKIGNSFPKIMGWRVRWYIYNLPIKNKKTMEAAKGPHPIIQWS